MVGARRIGTGRLLRAILLTLLSSAFPLATVNDVSATHLGWRTPWGENVSIDPQLYPFNFHPSAAEGPNQIVWLVRQTVPVEGSPAVLLKRYNYLIWFQEEPVSASPGDQISPEIIRLSNDSMMIAWSGGTSDFDIYYRFNKGGAWFPEVQLTSGPANDTSVSLLQTANGRIWAVWERKQAGGFDIYYKYYDGTSWSSDFQLTSDLADDRSPSIAQTKDGRIWAVWSSYRPGLHSDIFYKTFNGTAWSQDAPLILDTASRDDSDPEIIQDRDGTIWVFWTRELPGTSPEGRPILQDEIFVVHSFDNGASWSTPDQLTSTLDVGERDIALGHFSDRSIWLFWSHQNPFGTIDIKFSRTAPIFAHDTAVTRIEHPDRARWNTTVLLNVTVSNRGDFSETVNVTLYLGSQSLGSQETSLGPGGTEIVTFTLKTSIFPHARYQLKATALIPLESQGNLPDNTLLGGSLALSPPGDLDVDGDVDINDAARLAIAFDSRPGNPRWDPVADLNGNLIVDILDASLLAYWFDTKIP